MTKIMKGQQQALMQSKKEMEDRIARDRAKAEAELRKKYGPDYVMAKKTPQVKEYEAKKEEREEMTEGMRFTQRELVENFAKFIVANKTIKPEAAGEFLRFIEASKVAALAPEGSTVAVVMPSASSSESAGASSSSAPDSSSCAAVASSPADQKSL